MEKEKIQHTQPTDTSVEVTTPPEGNKKQKKFKMELRNQ